ncbi:hypothetical protein FO519_008518 [Halicephalobus sp. NKZ332]|nr:hypothetical protein FO519_008518 [Halicephalobus sp. NKZ332]
MIDRGLYGNILKDWTLGECYDEAKVDYWNFEVPNHVDLENFGTVDDSHFFSNLVDQLSTPLKENPVSQDQKENSRPISRAFRKSSEEKINFIKLSQENKLKANVDFTELSLFNSRKNRMSERARRRSRQITIEEEKLQKNASNGVNPRFDDGIIPKLNIFTKENGSVGSISLFSNSNIKEKPARNPLRPISYMKEDELTRSTACANDINTKDQVVRNVSRRISFSKENEPVGWASRLSNRNPKDQVSRNPPRQNSFTMKINPLGLAAHVNDINKKDQVRNIFRSGSFTKKTEPTRPITCQRSITMKETRTGNLPTQDPTTRERFIFSRREAQKAVNKEVSLSTRLLRRLSASKPSERKSENEQTEKNKFVNSVRDSCNVGNEHAMKDEKSTKVPGFFRETQSSVLRAAKNRSSIDTVPSGIPRILNRQMSADGIPRSGDQQADAVMVIPQSLLRCPRPPGECQPIPPPWTPRNDRN